MRMKSQIKKKNDNVVKITILVEGCTKADLGPNMTLTGIIPFGMIYYFSEG